MTEKNPDHIAENMSSSTNSIWKTAQYGESASYHDIENHDPILADKLKPVNGFKVQFEGYKYSVKAYDNERVIVYRQKLSTISYSQNYMYNNNGSSCSPKQITYKNFVHDGLDSIMTENCSSNSNKRIKDIKLVKPDEFILEDGWEIHSNRPIVVIREQPFVTLVKWDVVNQ